LLELGELRWILLGIGIVAIAAIWWWTARRSRQAPGNAELREPTMMSASAAPMSGETAIPERRGAEPRPDARIAAESRAEARGAEPRLEARAAPPLEPRAGAHGGMRAAADARMRDGGPRVAGDARAAAAGADSHERGTVEPPSIRAGDFADVPALDQPILIDADPIDFSLDSSRATGAPRFPSVHDLAAATPHAPDDEEGDADATTVRTVGVQLPLEVPPSSRDAWSPAAAPQVGAAPGVSPPILSPSTASTPVASPPTLSPTASPPVGSLPTSMPSPSIASPSTAFPSAASPPTLSPPITSPPVVSAAAVPPQAPAATSGRWRQASENSDRYSSTGPQVVNSAEKQKIVALRVCAVGDERWTGAAVINALEMHGLAYGRYHVFHRRHSDGRSIFCVASLVEPGTFDLASMPSELYRGVSLFAVLPGPVDPVQTIEAMLETARDLARELSGTMQDAKGMPFSPQRAEALLKDVSRFQALLA
jgi:cell division protein ZipA